MNKNVKKKSVGFTNVVLMKKFGAYTPPDGCWNDLLNLTSGSKPIDGMDLIYL